MSSSIDISGPVWSCTQCTLQNSDGVHTCSVCNSPRNGAIAFDYRQYLRDLGFQEKTVPGDGHCLYWCIVLSGLCTDVQHLRDMVAQYQLAYQIRTTFTVVGQSFDDYIKGIRKDTHADNPEIVAICEILGIDIIIHRTTSDEVTHIHPITEEHNTSSLVNVLYDGSHYNLLVPIDNGDRAHPVPDTSNDAAIARSLASL